MKNIFLSLITLSILASCASDSKSVDKAIESGNLEKIRAKRNELVTKQTELNTTLSLIDAAIAKLDTLKKLPLVTVFQAKQMNFNHFLELQGNVQTKQNIILYPEYSGLLTKIYVKEGQKVSQGQLLASIDDGGLSQQLAQMEVQASLAKTTFERQERLWEQKIGSEIDYLQAKAAFEGQQKSISQMKSQLAKTSITAPFSGVIDNVISEQGSVVSAGQSEVFRIVNLNNMYIEVEVPENYLPYIENGKTVEISFPIIGESLSTKIRQVGNYINPGNRTFKIEVGVPNKNGFIKPNLTAKVKINDYTNPEAILIPQSVISEDAEGQQYVYVSSSTDTPNEAIVNRVIVETGKTEGDFVEISKGITKGDIIISEGARSVKDGQTVKILSVDNDE